MFKLWSEVKKEANEELSPTFGFRNWGDLSSDDKYLIWKYLEWHLFEKGEYDQSFSYGNKSCNYKFFGDYYETNNKLTRVVDSISILNLKYKVISPRLRARGHSEPTPHFAGEAKNLARMGDGLAFARDSSSRRSGIQNDNRGSRFGKSPPLRRRGSLI